MSTLHGQHSPHRLNHLSDHGQALGDDPAAEDLADDERVVLQVPTAADEQRLAQMRARLGMRAPSTLPKDPAVREMVVQDMLLEAEAHAERVEAQFYQDPA